MENIGVSHVYIATGYNIVNTGTTHMMNKVNNYCVWVCDRCFSLALYTTCPARHHQNFTFDDRLIEFPYYLQYCARLRE